MVKLIILIKMINIMQELAICLVLVAENICSMGCGLLGLFSVCSEVGSNESCSINVQQN
jgi:hypothetical protein